MSWSSIIFCSVGGAVAVAFEVALRRRLSLILTRSCAGRQWRRSFPGASNGDIRDFLQIFVDGFNLRRKYRLAFRPNNRIMEVYRAINPPRWTVADCMELEIFDRLLQRHFGVALASVWHDDLTLGELFRQTRRH